MLLSLCCANLESKVEAFSALSENAAEPTIRAWFSFLGRTNEVMRSTREAMASTMEPKLLVDLAGDFVMNVYKVHIFYYWIYQYKKKLEENFYFFACIEVAGLHYHDKSAKSSWGCWGHHPFQHLFFGAIQGP